MSTRAAQAKLAQAAAAVAQNDKAKKGKRSAPPQVAPIAATGGIGALNEIDLAATPASKKNKGVLCASFFFILCFAPGTSRR